MPEYNPYTKEHKENTEQDAKKKAEAEVWVKLPISEKMKVWFKLESPFMQVVLIFIFFVGLWLCFIYYLFTNR